MINDHIPTLATSSKNEKEDLHIDYPDIFGGIWIVCL